MVFEHKRIRKAQQDALEFGDAMSTIAGSGENLQSGGARENLTDQMKNLRLYVTTMSRETYFAWVAEEAAKLAWL